MPFFHTPSI